jgi:hypothetical protein
MTLQSKTDLGFQEKVNAYIVKKIFKLKETRKTEDGNRAAVPGKGQKKGGSIAGVRYFKETLASKSKKTKNRSQTACGILTGKRELKT